MLKNFEQWDIDDVERTFGLQRRNQHPTMDAWLAAKQSISEQERDSVRHLQMNILHKIDSWNEDELKFKFIAPFVSIVGYDTDRFNAFTQRTISATVNNVKLSGRVDFVVAVGKSKPIQPFFFLHEYKRSRGRDNDPLAQLLVEMLAAQELNEHSHPLYGCYVQGRNWFFVILDGQDYSESIAFDATKGDAFTMLRVLKEAKAIIGRILDSQSNAATPSAR
jgi:hypothetical protein